MSPTYDVDDAKVALYLTHEANEALRASLRLMVRAMERSWKAEGWSLSEHSGQAPLDQLEARNEARRLLGEPYEAEGR